MEAGLAKIHLPFCKLKFLLPDIRFHPSQIFRLYCPKVSVFAEFLSLKTPGLELDISFHPSQIFRLYRA